MYNIGQIDQPEARKNFLLEPDLETLVVEFEDDMIPGEYYFKIKLEETTIAERSILLSDTPSWSLTNIHSPIISPNEDPEWLMSSWNHWDGSSTEFEVTIVETWMRGIDGYPIQIGSENPITKSVSGLEIISENLKIEPRIGSQLHHSFSVIQVGKNENIEITKKLALFLGN